MNATNTMPLGFEAVSKELTDLPEIMRRAWASMMPHTMRAMEVLHHSMPAQSIDCRQCESPRELLLDRSVAVTARAPRPDARYEPCRQCMPWVWYRARSENMGIPPMQPQCTIRRDSDGQVISRRLSDPRFVTRSPRLYITGSRRSAIHALIMSACNGWYLAQRTIEQCSDMGARQVLDMAIGHQFTVAIEVSDSDRGEFLAQIMAGRDSNQRTWIIDPDGLAASIIPDDFYPVTAP